MGGVRLQFGQRGSGPGAGGFGVGGVRRGLEPHLFLGVGPKGVELDGDAAVEVSV